MKVIRKTRKPVVFTAVQWPGPGMSSTNVRDGYCISLRPGDWTIIAPNGERDFCAAEDFEDEYEEYGE